MQGDWDQGLAHLAKGSDGLLKDLAAKGLKPPEDSAALVVLGDAWYDAAEKTKGKDKAELRTGAAYWYSQAESGLTGLVKAKIEKRLAELGGRVAVAQPMSMGKLAEAIVNDPAFQQWIKTVAVLPAEKQVEAVAKKLMELNPGFDGKVTPKIEGGVVTSFEFVTDDVTDISPVRRC